MTAVANPPSYQQITRPTWGSNGQGGLNSMNPDEVARMLMPRKSAQRANSSSSTSSHSSSSSTATLTQSAPQPNGVPMPTSSDVAGWGTAAARKKPVRAGPWPSGKAEPLSSVTTARPQPVVATNGVSAASSMSSLHQPSPIVPSQHLQSSSQQQNGTRPIASNPESPVLYLLSMNGTFERKTIVVPYFPDVLRIGRQTNAKTVPTPSNGFFDSKVLSRQHAEIWADRSGKVWIRDVRSSNGTFVNGARLSAENRDSEPHELQSQDHLELGIDIVSEDQKTVVHHKVAAKVEHSGFLGASTNVLDMSFGELDPANGALAMPSQNGLQARGRTSSQGSAGSSVRVGPGTGANNNMVAGHQRPINFWLTPVTTEQIVKKLTHETRTARLQTHDLGRTEQFFSTLMSNQELKGAEKGIANDVVKHAQANGGVMPFKMEGKPRFSDPPAPPPQQPLPEKPDTSRSHAFDHSTPSLKRSNTERPGSFHNVSPVRQGSNIEMGSLVEALKEAKKEIDLQNGHIRDLRELLQKEREARETAEGRAKILELESTNAKMNGEIAEHPEGSIVDEAFDPPVETPEDRADAIADDPMVSVESVETSTSQLQHKLDLMMTEMRDMKQHMEAYRQRAEIAESERDADRKTLAEMIMKIRSEEARTSSTDRARSLSKTRKKFANLIPGDENDAGESEILQEHSNGIALNPSGSKNPLSMTLSRLPPANDQLLYHSGPYASMVGVVLLGMGLMAYMNGWQKVER
ncbi:MAG: hypothetical protein M1818_001591 [Claussenomyces sp. TS43310]|nr:MAG: hypothetical protein M1818_001591 [Claussenomyces sp. TS43310]